MNPPVPPLQPLGPYRVRTVNASANPVNRIHADETAIAYGFRAGLVDGSLLYGHMTTPLVERLGSAWLDASVSELRLLRPAYDGDVLTIDGEPLAEAGAPPGYRLRACNEAGEVLATLETVLPPELPPVDERAQQAPAAPETPVEPIAWRHLHPHQALRALRWSPTPEAHARWCDVASDALALYRADDAPRLQPGLVLQGANDVFSHHYRLEPWLHVGSHIVQRAPLRLGDPIEIRATLQDKWERKGNQFVNFYVVLRNGAVPAVEIMHTAIFHLRTPTPP